MRRTRYKNIDDLLRDKKLIGYQVSTKCLWLITENNELVVSHRTLTEQYLSLLDLNIIQNKSRIIPYTIEVDTGEAILQQLVETRTLLIKASDPPYIIIEDIVPDLGVRHKLSCYAVDNKELIVSISPVSVLERRLVGLRTPEEDSFFSNSIEEIEKCLSVFSTSLEEPIPLLNSNRVLLGFIGTHIPQTRLQIDESIRVICENSLYNIQLPELVIRLSDDFKLSACNWLNRIYLYDLTYDLRLLTVSKIGKVLKSLSNTEAKVHTYTTATVLLTKQQFIGLKHNFMLPILLIKHRDIQLRILSSSSSEEDTQALATLCISDTEIVLNENVHSSVMFDSSMETLTFEPKISNDCLTIDYHFLSMSDLIRKVCMTITEEGPGYKNNNIMIYSIRGKTNKLSIIKVLSQLHELVIKELKL